MQFTTRSIAMLLIAASLGLSACGVRDEEGVGGLEGRDAAIDGELNVRVISDRNNISTGGSDIATITALVTNDKNQAVANEPVEVSASGGVLQAISAVTDDNGEAQATLALAQDYQNKTIEVTVQAGGSVGTVRIDAAGTTLDIAGPTSLVLGNEAELSVTLTAGDGQPIVNRELQFSSRAGNVISPQNSVTDTSGTVTVSVTTLNGDDEISVLALDGTVTGLHRFTVAGDLLAFAGGTKGRELQVDRTYPVTVTWESQGQPVAFQPLRFGITAGSIIGDSTLLTNNAGQATVNVRSSSAGPATITVEASEQGDPATQTTVEFVAKSPATVLLQASSARVQTRDNSTMTATVTDFSGNPVKGRVVLFSSNNLKGGSLNPASAVTNSAGEASVVFTAGSLATETNELQVMATVKDATFNANPVTRSTELTVVERRLNVTLGASNFIEERAELTQYAMPFVVQVADGSGVPLKDATVEMAAHPLSYSKGTMRHVDTQGQTYDESSDKPNWGADAWAVRISVTCPSEDLNRNRILDAGEDLNGNGSLDPQDPALLAPIKSDDALATLTGNTLETDSRGSGYFDMIYPTSNSRWAELRITARARAFNVESVTSFDTFLPVLATRVADPDIIPPNHISPYGTGTSCTDTL